MRRAPARVCFYEVGRSAAILIALSPMARPLPALGPLPILIAVVAVPMPAFFVLVPVSLLALKPLITVGALPTPLTAVLLPLSLLPLIPIIFVGSDQVRR